MKRVLGTDATRSAGARTTREAARTTTAFSLLRGRESSGGSRALADRLSRAPRRGYGGGHSQTRNR